METEVFRLHEVEEYVYGVAEEEVLRDHDDILGRNAKKVGLKYG